jgi:hypothetical protein
MMRTTILAGTAYLRELHGRCDSMGFLAAYNTGAARYEDHRATCRALSAKTRAYVAAVAPPLAGVAVNGTVIVEAVIRFCAEAPLFVVHAESGTMDPPLHPIRVRANGRPTKQ